MVNADRLNICSCYCSCVLAKSPGSMLVYLRDEYVQAVLCVPDKR